MPLPVEPIKVETPVTELLRETTVATLTFLVALEFREFIFQSIEMLSPTEMKGKLIFNLFVLLLVILLAILAVVYWEPA